MKLYDFHCKACGDDFEELVRELSDARCPTCGAKDVEKQLSAFSVGRSGGNSVPSGGGCGGGFCGGGVCGIN